MKKYLENGMLRRNDLLQLTPAELTLRNAQLHLEKLPGHTLLTEASVLIMQARDKLADYLEVEEAAQ